MTNIQDAFRFHRFRGLTASKALERARADEAGNVRRYAPCDTRKPMRAGVTFKAYGEECFWSEYPADYMRPICLADRYGNQRGWYIDDFEDEVARGVVYQLPAASDGSERFLYGVADPHNDGPAILSLSIATDKGDAARWADGMAERYAEEERDYSAAWQAYQRFTELGDRMPELFDDVFQVCAARREHKRLSNPSATVLQVLTCKAWELIEELREVREKRRKLASDFEGSKGWGG